MWHVFWNVKLLRRKLQKQLYFVVNCILFKGVEIEVEEFLCSKTVTSTMLVMSRTATVSFGSCCCSQSYPIWETDVIVPKARGKKKGRICKSSMDKMCKELKRTGVKHYHVRLMKAMDPWFEETDAKLLSLFGKAHFWLWHVQLQVINGAARLEKNNLCVNTFDTLLILQRSWSFLARYQ